MHDWSAEAGPGRGLWSNVAARVSGRFLLLVHSPTALPSYSNNLESTLPVCDRAVAPPRGSTPCLRPQRGSPAWCGHLHSPSCKRLLPRAALDSGGTLSCFAPLNQDGPIVGSSEAKSTKGNPTLTCKQLRSLSSFLSFNCKPWCVVRRATAAFSKSERFHDPVGDEDWRRRMAFRPQLPGTCTAEPSQRENGTSSGRDRGGLPAPCPLDLETAVKVRPF